MMKRILILMALMCVAVTLFAQVALPEHQFAAGRWAWSGTRLVQNDIHSGLAKLNVRAPQSGGMLYEFNARYVDGLEDGHGGIGIHLFMDNALNAASWGGGNSILLWLNYDEHPVTRGFITGFTAQVYKSTSNSTMELVDTIDLNWALPYFDISGIVPVKIWVDGNTGEIRIYDPTDPTLSDYFYIHLSDYPAYFPRSAFPLRGNWVALRTNGISVSFGLGL
ncbi:MAG: hypothetical protein LBI14_02150 [Treponema sp.]|jgi:hypothetical protein|nr:hypothetical protein [Treponema sp.]